MSKLIISLFAAAGIAWDGGANAADNTTMSRDAYKADKDRIEAQYKADKDRCSPLSGNAKDVCQAEAKGKEKVAKAELEANYKNSDKARNDAREAKDDAGAQGSRPRPGECRLLVELVHRNGTVVQQAVGHCQGRLDVTDGARLGDSAGGVRDSYAVNYRDVTLRQVTTMLDDASLAASGTAIGAGQVHNPEIEAEGGCAVLDRRRDV